MYETWWFWVAFGLVLVTLETVLPGFVLLGFGIGAVVVGLLISLGLSMTLPKLVLLFATVSLITWAGLRALFRPKKANVKTFENDINDELDQN